MLSLGNNRRYAARAHATSVSLGRSSPRGLRGSAKAKAAFAFRSPAISASAATTFRAEAELLELWLVATPTEPLIERDKHSLGHGRGSSCDENYADLGLSVSAAVLAAQVTPVKRGCRRAGRSRVVLGAGDAFRADAVTVQALEDRPLNPILVRVPEVGTKRRASGERQDHDWDEPSLHIL
jgi:hypothetical protein